jgi:hypothetical protein
MQQAQQSPHPDKESTVISGAGIAAESLTAASPASPHPPREFRYRVPASRMFLRTMAIAMQTNAATRNR